MRSKICSVQQALTAEAANIVKQAVTVAKRRGHAQVTPLHVASAMLACSRGLLRRACLQSQSHPLQCKALELCFNVALNRLPASPSNALFGAHSTYPSLSNALVAAFKRAQAHQRRGSIENQQQPILALKIEIQQLIISILDDPSVSRVMREAGFSSTLVKNKVQQAVSLEIYCQSTTPTKNNTKPQVFNDNDVPQSLPFHQFGVIISKPLDQVSYNDDVMSVLNTLANRKRNTVVVGDCLASTESVVRGVKDKIDGDLAPGELRSVRFISFPIFSFKDIPKEEVEQKLLELRCSVKSYISRGIVLYLGDLKWVSDFWSDYIDQQRTSYYCSVEHMIIELKRLVHGIDETGRLWLMGIATFQTYKKCKAGHPSLEAIWELYPLTIPVGSLSLSLNFDSDSQSHSRSKASVYGNSWPLLESAVDNHLTFSNDYSSVNFNREASNIQSKDLTTHLTFSTSLSLPSWLHQPKEDTTRISIIDDKQESTDACHLSKKWNSFCSSVHKEPCYSQKTIKYDSSPSSPNSLSSQKCNNLNQSHLNWPVIFEPTQGLKEQKIWNWIPECVNEGTESNLINAPKKDILSNPNSGPNSASSSEAMNDIQGLQIFKEFNDQNMKILCNSLEKKVPRQKYIIPEIATTILECRSGMSKRKYKSNHEEEREDTWLSFLGVDSEGKEKIARELAILVFGSQANYASIGVSNFSSTAADSTEELKNKRARDELGSSYHERFGLALNENPHRVFFMEDLEQVDYFSQKAIKKSIESGKVKLASGEKVPLKDAIIIFNSESFSSVSRACSPRRRLKTGEKEYGSEDKDPVVSLDLNISVKVEDDEDEYLNIAENQILKSVDRQIIFQKQEF